MVRTFLKRSCSHYLDEINSVVLRKIIEKLDLYLTQTFCENAAQNPRMVSHGEVA